MYRKIGIIVLVIIALAGIGIAFGKAVPKIRCAKFFGGGGAASSYVAQAKALEATGDLAQAKLTYQKLANDFANSSEIMKWQKKIETKS